MMLYKCLSDLITCRSRPDSKATPFHTAAAHEYAQLVGSRADRMAQNCDMFASAARKRKQVAHMSARKRRQLARQANLAGGGIREAVASILEEVEEEEEVRVFLKRCRLDLLPDDILLNIMSLLDTKSVLLLSRVCKRFNHLHGNPAVWRDVDVRLDKRTQCTIIGLKYLGLYTWRVKVCFGLDNVHSLDDAVLIQRLFVKCPNIRSITLGGCRFHVSLLESIYL